MQFGIRGRWFPLLIILALLLSMAACAVPSKVTDRTGIKFTKGNMFHIQQVLERYDANGNTIPQYIELWLTRDKGRSVELDPDGKELRVTLDTGTKHLVYDPATLSGKETGKSELFLVNFSAMKKIYPNKQYSEDGRYAERDCVFHLMDGGSDDQWIKIYLDKATGYTLFCDSETFRLRTALFEEIPEEDSLFAEPAGLNLKGGNGQ